MVSRARKCKSSSGSGRRGELPQRHQWNAHKLFGLLCVCVWKKWQKNKRAANSIHFHFPNRLFSLFEVAPDRLRYLFFSHVWKTWWRFNYCFFSEKKTNFLCGKKQRCRGKKSLCQMTCRLRVINFVPVRRLTKVAIKLQGLLRPLVVQKINDPPPPPSSLLPCRLTEFLALLVFPEEKEQKCSVLQRQCSNLLFYLLWPKPITFFSFFLGRRGGGREEAKSNKIGLLPGMGGGEERKEGNFSIVWLSPSFFFSGIDILFLLQLSRYLLLPTFANWERSRFPLLFFSLTFPPPLPKKKHQKFGKCRAFQSVEKF